MTRHYARPCQLGIVETTPSLPERRINVQASLVGVDVSHHNVRTILGRITTNSNAGTCQWYMAASCPEVKQWML